MNIVMKKMHLRLLVLLLTFALAFASVSVTPVSAADIADTIGTITSTSGLKLREGPGTEYSAILTVPYGTAVVVLDTSASDWYKITYNDYTGYVSSRYVRIASAPSSSAASSVIINTVTSTSGLKLRKGAGTEYGSILTVPCGAAVSVLDTSASGWYKVVYNGCTGYMGTRYGKISAAPYTATITSSSGLKLRKGAGTKYGSILTVPYGATVSVLDTSASGWYKVIYNGYTGYVATRYAKITDTFPTTPTPEITIEEWHTTLVNPWNEISDDYSITLKTVYSSYKVDKRCYSYLVAMLNDCEAAGYEPLICSAYRTQTTQNSLYQNKVKRLLAQGLSQEQAEIEAAKVVAVPGTSEHQLGLAVDIVDADYQLLTSAQANTDTQKWLMKNSWKYGFILRYPKEKTEITGIIYEPWHYRYVGYALAKQLYESGQTLEEYLASTN